MIIYVSLYLKVHSKVNEIDERSLIYSGYYDLCRTFYIVNRYHMGSDLYIKIMKIAGIILIYSAIAFLFNIGVVALNVIFNKISIIELLSFYPINVTLILIIGYVLLLKIISYILYFKYDVKNSYNILDNFIPLYKSYMRLYEYSLKSKLNHRRINYYFRFIFFIKVILIIIWGKYFYDLIV